jgi:hypothetical protein
VTHPRPDHPPGATLPTPWAGRPVGVLFGQRTDRATASPSGPLRFSGPQQGQRQGRTSHNEPHDRSFVESALRPENAEAYETLLLPRSSPSLTRLRAVSVLTSCAGLGGTAATHYGQSAESVYLGGVTGPEHTKSASPIGNRGADTARLAVTMAERGGVYGIGGGSILGPILASRGTL